MGDRDGFGLLELIVVLGLIVLVAGLVLPALADRDEESRHAAALRETAALVVALRHYETDTGRPPQVALDGWLAGPGHRPGTRPGMGAMQTRWNDLSDLLLRDPGVPHWKGPYVETLGPDPWGQAYVVNSRAYRSADEHVWVLSAGPDGVLQTDGTGLQTDGDDVGVMVR